MATPQEGSERITLTAAAEFASYPPSTEQTCWAITSLKAPFYEPSSRAPVDIAAVIDKSGSMAGNKLELVRKTLLFVIDQLKECDRLSLVTYDTNVKLECGLTKMDKTNKEKVKRLVKSITDGSSTNLCGGLVTGMEQIAYCTGEKAQVQSVLLLTDGLANQGIRTKDGILGEMRKLQDPPPAKVASKKFDGTVYTFGFGSDHDSTLLEAISTQGGGVYYYIDSHEKIPESFADCLGGLLSVMGQNLSLKLEVLAGNTVTEVHANRTVTWANNCCEIALGDLQSEEERDMVLEMKLPALPAPQTDSVVRVTLTYFNVITSTMDTISCDLVITRADGARGPPNEAVDVQKNRIIATAALKKAEPLADEGKLADAKAVLQEAIAQLEASATAGNDYCKALIEDLKRSLESMKSREAYRGHGKLYMHSKMQAHSVQRSNFVDDHGYYQNKSKMAFRGLAKNDIDAVPDMMDVMNDGGNEVNEMMDELMDDVMEENNDLELLAELEALIQGKPAQVETSSNYNPVMKDSTASGELPSISTTDQTTKKTTDDLCDS